MGKHSGCKKHNHYNNPNNDTDQCQNAVNSKIGTQAVLCFYQGGFASLDLGLFDPGTGLN